MAGHSDPLEYFRRRLCRRACLLRLTETVALGALAGAIVFLLGMPILLWQGQDGLVALGALLAIGAAGGLVTFAVQRPSRLAVIMEADSQLGLDDLLSTAMALRDSTHKRDDVWQIAVVATACACCAGMTARHVTLARLGRGAWGGIALGIVLAAVTPLLLPAGPRGVAAEGNRRFLTPRQLLQRALTDKISRNHRESTAESSWPTARGESSPVPSASFLSAPRDMLAMESGRSAQAGPVTSSEGGSGPGTVTAPRNRATTDELALRGGFKSVPAGTGLTLAATGGAEVNGAIGASAAPDANDAMVTVTVGPSPLPWQPSQSAAGHSGESGLHAELMPLECRDLIESYFSRR